MAPPTSILSAAEASYILDSLLLGSPIRTDGRPLVAFRPFSLATAVAPQANGSARVLLGGGPTGRGATEVVCAVRLEVGPPPPPSAMAGEGASAVGARPDVVCSVEWCVPRSGLLEERLPALFPSRGLACSSSGCDLPWV